jgi:Zn-finger nucleic acid-binding protein
VHGIWLDRGEFKQIINYLKNKSDYEVLNHYTKNLAVELWEVFSGPETFREEMADFFTLLKII